MKRTANKAKQTIRKLAYILGMTLGMTLAMITGNDNDQRRAADFDPRDDKSRRFQGRQSDGALGPGQHP